MNNPFFPVFAALLLASAPTARSQSTYASLQIPQQIQYQGRVSQNGSAWSGEGYFVFALIENGTVLWNNWQGTYDPATGTLSDPGGTVLADKFTTAQVTGGAFALRLGSEAAGNNKPILPTVFFNAQTNAVRPNVKLAVWFSADSQTFTRLSPDVSLASVPYAMTAGIAETIQDRAVTTAKLNDGAVTARKIAAGAVGPAQVAAAAIDATSLAANSVTGGKVLDGSLTGADLALASISTDRLSLEYASYAEHKPAGQGGGACGANTVQTRTLNTTVASAGTSISRSGNVITLQPGTYLIEARCPAGYCHRHQGTLYNLSNDGVELHGTAEYSEQAGGAPVFTSSEIKGWITVSGASKNFEIRHFTETAYDSGLGNQRTPTSQTPGTVVFTTVHLIRLN